MIPVARPVIDNDEIDAAINVLKSGNYTSGPIVEIFEEQFSNYIGTKYAVACNSGTAALHMVYLYLMARGKKFITTPMSFFATVSAGLMTGAEPIFVDVDDRCNINADLIEEAITDDVIAIAPVHFYGHPCEIEKIVEIGNKYNIPVIEDCAQAHGAEYKHKCVGSFGFAGCFSFFSTKNMTTIEGGMITTNNFELYSFCKCIRSHGMTDRNTHMYVGYNYRMSELNAAIGLAQFTKLNKLNDKRIENSLFLQNHISNKNLVLFISKNYVKDVYFWQPVYTDKPKEFSKYLKENGIGFRYRYNEPLYKQPVLDYLYDGQYLENAERFSGKMFGLPNYPGLTDTDLEKVVEVVNGFTC